MGCLNSANYAHVNTNDKSNKTPTTPLTEEDNLELLQNMKKYEFDPEYDLTELKDIENENIIRETKLISRRPSISLSIAQIERLQEFIDRKQEKTSKITHSIKDQQTMPEIKEMEEKSQSDSNDSSTNSQNNNNKKPNTTEAMFIKQYTKDDPWNAIAFKREAKILKQLHSHNNIVKYMISYQDEQAFFLGMQYCCDGTLLQYIYNKAHMDESMVYSESTISNIMQIIVSVLDHCHSMNIVHRNVCLENLYWNNKDRKIIVTGWDDADYVDDDQVYDDFVGQLYYLSPESLKMRHGWHLKKIDMFAVGIICYILTFGAVPFSAKDTPSICKKIIKCEVLYPLRRVRGSIDKNTYDNARPAQLSMRCKNFMESLITKYPFMRRSAHQTAKHPFLINECSDTHIEEGIPFKLHCYETAMKIRRLLVEHKYKETGWTKFEQNELIKVFENVFSLDKDDITRKDLKGLLVSMGMHGSDAELRSHEFFDIMDPSKSGSINISKATQSRRYHNKYAPERVNSHSNVIGGDSTSPRSPRSPQSTMFGLKKKKKKHKKKYEAVPLTSGGGSVSSETNDNERVVTLDLGGNDYMDDDDDKSESSVSLLAALSIRPN